MKMFDFPDSIFVINLKKIHGYINAYDSSMVLNFHKRRAILGKDIFWWKIPLRWSTPETHRLQICYNTDTVYMYV